MGRPYATPEQWGQQTTFQVGSWSANVERVVLTRDTPEEGTIPQTSTLICGVNNADVDFAQDYQLRWVLTAGVGGARQRVVFDATRFTRIAMPLEAFTLSLLCDPDSDTAPDFPGSAVEVFAFVGEGGVATDQDEGPVFSEAFRLSAPNPISEIIPVPVGATAVRVSGPEPIDTPAASPFKTTCKLQVRRGNVLLYSMKGLGAAVADPSLFSLYMAGGWIPLTSSPTNVVIQDTAAGARGFVQFKLDL